MEKPSKRPDDQGAGELFWRNGIGMMAAALAGLATLTVARSLVPGGGVALMRAVLDMSFWLATVAIVIALRLSRGRTRRAPSATEPPLDPAGKASRWRPCSLLTNKSQLNR